MNKAIKIFYSWQSDLPAKFNNDFIKACIQEAIKVINNEKSNQELRLEIDHGTRNRSGSPNIVDSILKKIENSDIFICDVTIINKPRFPFLSSKRLCPNPNVMLELGFALNSLGWPRVICINNLAINKPEDLPFDIKQNKISTYQPSSKRNQSDAKKELTRTLIDAIQSILHDNPNKHKYIVLDRDKALFEEIDKIIPEKSFLNHVEIISITNRINTEQVRLFDTIIQFSKYESNKFSNHELNQIYLKLINDLDRFLGYTSTHMFPLNHIQSDVFIDNDGNECHSHYNGFIRKKHMSYDEYQEYLDEKHLELAHLSLDVTDTYNTFRKMIRIQLYI